jgi:hypothetical protein
MDSFERRMKLSEPLEQVTVLKLSVVVRRCDPVGEPRGDDATGSRR